MIAATILALWLYFGSGSGMFGQFMAQYVEDPIKEVVKDEKRQEKALDALDKLQDDIEAFNDNVLDDSKVFDELVNNYDSTPVAFDKMIASTLEKRQKELGTMWEHRKKILEHVTAEEWSAIVAKAEAAQKSDR